MGIGGGIGTAPRARGNGMGVCEGVGIRIAGPGMCIAGFGLGICRAAPEIGACPYVCSGMVAVTGIGIIFGVGAGIGIIGDAGRWRTLPLRIGAGVARWVNGGAGYGSGIKEPPGMNGRASLVMAPASDEGAWC